MAAETVPKKQACFLRSVASPAFASYCECVYGKALNQYGTADMEQLDLLLRTLQLGPGMAVLDAGCGTGQTTHYLAETSGASFVGLDKSEASITHALALSKNGGQLDFHVGDMDSLDFPPGSFDAVVCIETLYFPQ